jgi:hypothetical protein
MLSSIDKNHKFTFPRFSVPGNVHRTALIIRERLGRLLPGCRLPVMNLRALELDKVVRLDGSKRFGWWAARKRPEVPDHVHLIVIICSVRDFEP